ncbi:hypothetical protein ACFRKB_00550 [Streptomyces scopuliridis]
MIGLGIGRALYAHVLDRARELRAVCVPYSWAMPGSSRRGSVR